MIDKKYTFEYVPQVFKRGHHVLLALFSKDKQSIYLARKQVYPANIYRLFGGGLENEESPLLGAMRELKEETGCQIGPRLFVPMEKFVFHFSETSSENSYDFYTSLYEVTLPDNMQINPADDVDEMKLFTKAELKSLIEAYSHLSSDLVEQRPEQKFRWTDWGIVFGSIHQIVLDNWN